MNKLSSRIHRGRFTKLCIRNVEQRDEIKLYSTHIAPFPDTVQPLPVRLRHPQPLAVRCHKCWAMRTSRSSSASSSSSIALSLPNSLTFWWLEKRVEATTNQRFPSSSSSCCLTSLDSFSLYRGDLVSAGKQSSRQSCLPSRQGGLRGRPAGSRSFFSPHVSRWRTITLSTTYSSRSNIPFT
jgi:hypothetical protein